MIVKKIGHIICCLVNKKENPNFKILNDNQFLKPDANNK